MFFLIDVCQRARRSKMSSPWKDFIERLINGSWRAVPRRMSEPLHRTLDLHALYFIDHTEKIARDHLKHTKESLSLYIDYEAALTLCFDCRFSLKGKTVKMSVVERSGDLQSINNWNWHLTVLRATSLSHFSSMFVEVLSSTGGETVNRQSKKKECIGLIHSSHSRSRSSNTSDNFAFRCCFLITFDSRTDFLLKMNPKILRKTAVLGGQTLSTIERAFAFTITPHSSSIQGKARSKGKRRVDCGAFIQQQTSRTAKRIDRSSCLIRLRKELARKKFEPAARSTASSNSHWHAHFTLEITQNSKLKLP